MNKDDIYNKINIEIQYFDIKNITWYDIISNKISQNIAQH